MPVAPVASLWRNIRPLHVYSCCVSLVQKVRGELQLICILAFHAHARRGLNSGRKTGLICIGEHYLGPEIAAVIRSRGVAAKQGFLMYYSKGDAIGTRVSVRYRRSGRLSEVVVKRGSTVYICTGHHTMTMFMNLGQP